MIRKRGLNLIFLLMVLLLTTQVFAEGKKEKIEGQKNIELEYTCWDNQKGTFEWFEDVFNRYQKLHPNVTIKVTGIPSGEYAKMTMLQMSTGNAPDIYPMFSSQLITVLDNHMLEPLDQWLDNSELNSRLVPITRKVAARNGHLYAFIRALPPWVFQVNKKILKEAGVSKIPENIDKKILV